ADPSLAWLRLPARLSSAAQQPHSDLRREGINPRHPGRRSELLELVQWRLVLFRPPRIFPRTLQWRQPRPVLDPDAHRADLELWLGAADSAHDRQPGTGLHPSRRQAFSRAQLAAFLIAVSKLLASNAGMV